MHRFGKCIYFNLNVHISVYLKQKWIHVYQTGESNVKPTTKVSTCVSGLLPWTQHRFASKVPSYNHDTSDILFIWWFYL